MNFNFSLNMGNPFKKNLAASPNEKAKRKLPYTPKSVYRTRKDIKDWNDALTLSMNAEDPSNHLLQLLYNEILIDAVLHSQKENRNQQVFSSAIRLLKPNGEVDQEQTDLLRRLSAYRKLTRAMLDSEDFGYSLCELDLKKNVDGVITVDVTDIPRTNVVPQKGLFYPDYQDPTRSIPYREMAEFGTWILEFNSGHVGVLNKTVSHVLFKRFAQSCWSELCEIFGIPPRVIKTETQDASMLDRAEKMMTDTGNAPWFIIDNAEEFEWGESSVTKGEVFESLINLCNNEICLVKSGAIIGQDTKHGNRSKDESSQEILWYLVQSDMELVTEYWNTIGIPALKKIGILKGDLRFEFEPSEDVEQLWKFTAGLIQYKEIDNEWLKSKFGVEITGNKEPSQSTQLMMDGSFFALAPATTTGARMKQLAQSCCGNLHTLTLSEAGLEEFDETALIKRFWDAGGNLAFDIELFNYTATALIGGLKKGWDKKKGKLSVDIGFEYGVDDPAVLTAYEMNLLRFSAAKNLAEAQKINEIFRRSKNFEQFDLNTRLVTKVFNKEWLLTEYQTAQLTGEAAATYNRLSKQTDLFPFWKYMTVGDNRVRPEHHLLDGLILPANDPRWKKLFPPNGWKCRCYIVGVMKHEAADINVKAMRAKADAYFGGEEFKKAEATGWGVNRAESGEVFTANQMYIRKFQGKAAKTLNNLKPADYGLKSYSQAKKDASDKLPAFSGTLEEFVKSNKYLLDYHKRKLTLGKLGSKGAEKAITLEKTRYLEALKESVATPSEVWINGENYDQFVTIKYYTDKTLITISGIESGNIYEVNTWFAVTERGNAIDNYRRGLLIYSKK